MPIPFYMDVHVHGAVTEQLRRRGVDVLTSQEDSTDRLPDDQLLHKSAALGRILVSYDIGLKALAEDWQRQQTPFGGLIWCHPMRLTIGQIATDLSEWQNVVSHLPL